MFVTKYLKGKIEVNKDLFKRISRYNINWVNRHDNRIRFLSGPHIGVEPIRFLKSEEDEFFEVVLRLDRHTAKQDFDEMPDIEKDRLVTSNEMYLTIVGLMSIVVTDSKIKLKDKEKIVKDLFFIISYRLITSMVVNSFQYDLQLDLAEATYEAMSKKFKVKELGSWQRLLNYRSQDFEKKGLYYPRLFKADNLAITKVIAAIRTRWIGHFSEQFEVIVKVKERNDKRLSSSQVKEGEEGEYVVEIENYNRNYFIYAKTILPIESEFVDKDIIRIVTDVYKRVDKKEFVKSLKYISHNYLTIKDIDSLIASVIKANIEYIYGTKMYPPYDKRVLQILLHCKGLWTSSRVKNPDVIYVKEELVKLIKEITGRKTENVVVPLTMSIVMYIFIKTVIGYKN